MMDMSYDEAIEKTAEMLALNVEKVRAEVDKIILDRALPDWRVGVALYKSKSGRLSNPPVEMEAVLVYKGTLTSYTKDGQERSRMNTIWMETKGEPKLWNYTLFGEQIEKWSDLAEGQVYQGTARLNRGGGTMVWEDRKLLAEGVLVTAEDLTKLMMSEQNVKAINSWKDGSNQENPPRRVLIGLCGRLIGKDQKGVEFVGLHIDSPVIPIWPKDWTTTTGNPKEGSVIMVLGKPNEYQGNVNFSPDIIHAFM